MGKMIDEMAMMTDLCEIVLWLGIVKESTIRQDVGLMCKMIDELLAAEGNQC